VSRGVAQLLFFFVAMAAGDAVYWFIGGAYQSHSQVRNALVVGQFLICVVAMLWLVAKLRRSVRARSHIGEFLRMVPHNKQLQRTVEDRVPSHIGRRRC